jgi:hypothetical protein
MQMKNKLNKKQKGNHIVEVIQNGKSEIIHFESRAKAIEAMMGYKTKGATVKFLPPSFVNKK